MAIFGKKKVEEEEDDDEDLLEEGDDKGRKLTRKLKDLNPENKKKRKEPPKPWGIRERLIVLVFFLVTVVVSGVLALSARNFKVSFFNLKTPTLESLNIFKEETIILEKIPD